MDTAGVAMITARVMPFVVPTTPRARRHVEQQLADILKQTGDIATVQAEVHGVRDDVDTLKADMKHLTVLVEGLVADRRLVVSGARIARWGLGIIGVGIGAMFGPSIAEWGREWLRRHVGL